MIYLLHYQPLGSSLDSIELLDGNIKAVKNVDRSIDIGATPPLDGHSFRCGRCVETEHLPVKARIRGRQRKLPDFCQKGRGQIVSQLFKDVVDSLEPETHQFVPVNLVWKGDQGAGVFYWFATCQRKLTLHQKFCHPTLKPDSRRWNNLDHDGRPVRDARIVFDKSLVNGLSMWSDPQLEGYIAVSEKFRARCEDAGLAGLKFDPHDLR